MGIIVFGSLQDISLTPPLILEASPIVSAVAIPLELKQIPNSFSMPRVASEMIFSRDPAHPAVAEKDSSILVSWKSTALSQKAELPCRIDLKFIKGKGLAPSLQKSLFWMDLTQKEEAAIEASVWVRTEAGEAFETERFCTPFQAPLLQRVEEYPENSPFRVLGQAKWLGFDRFSEKYGEGVLYLVSLGSCAESQWLSLRSGEWITWNNGRWEKGDFSAESSCAHILCTDGNLLIWEGWDDKKRYRRFSLGLEPKEPQKLRGGEILSAVRLRSEKQISCLLDKQCLILRQGDWALKTAGRWRALRRAEEKEAYRFGKLKGELFVLDRIGVRAGQKNLEGSFFNEQRTEQVSVEFIIGDKP